ncbi:uncharacterized protein N7483_000942 [Penicillium malachiteum]|uniref:uncharacterized protein n=1 Tax=Penicillium malachiteum TaxID=1324776 RepID=UPI002548A52A|nr:uncharacterized protein N7483_000942 [Penicillium malachiteum]KAJ5735817.1 hypothetical protein N7483_000942 [Penicillium malachiteum]
MASHHLAIAKASFSAGLLRPDPTSVPREEITTFHTSFDRALSHCSPANIQTCKAWLLHYVASSANRVGGLAKYLVALAGSDDAPTATKSSPSPKRRRLHILYLLNDLFHHSKYHLDATATFSTLSGSLQPYMVDLLGHAAAYDRQKYPRYHKRLDDLLGIWFEHGYFSPDLLHRLREVVKNSASAEAAPLSTDPLADDADAVKRPLGKDVPFVMPSTHGDQSTPYFDLPAGNWLPHIIPNSTIPLHPDSIKPLHFLGGPADETLVTVLKGFMKEVDHIYDTGDLVKDEENVDVDELGQRVHRDEITGDILDGETYYGWSRAFCQQMKKNTHNSSRDSQDRDRIDNGYKRRYSESSMSDRSRRSDSRSRSRSRVSRPKSHRHAPGSRSRSRESSYSPREPSPPHFPPPHQPSHAHPPATHSQPYNPQFGFPAPPPPPPQYPGTWPPAPPPHMPGMPFPPPGPGMSHPAFPPSFHAQQMNLPPGQPLPPGQYHFPPPHSGGHSGGQHGESRGSQGGRGWR